MDRLYSKGIISQEHCYFLKGSSVHITPLPKDPHCRVQNPKSSPGPIVPPGCHPGRPLPTAHRPPPLPRKPRPSPPPAWASWAASPFKGPLKCHRPGHPGPAPCQQCRADFLPSIHCCLEPSFSSPSLGSGLLPTQAPCGPAGCGSTPDSSGAASVPQTLFSLAGHSWSDPQVVPRGCRQAPPRP